MRPAMTIRNWKTLSSRVVFEAKHWFRVVQDTVQLPSNRIVDDYFRIEAQEYVLIYPKTKDGQILVLRQYKHGVGKTTMTFPAGFIDSGEQPLTAAKRELLEETGFRAKTWKQLGSFVLDGTRHNGTAHYFIAEDLERVSEPVYSDMEELDIRFMTTEELIKSVKQGELSLLPAVAILAMATNPLLSGSADIVENNS